MKKWIRRIVVVLTILFVLVNIMAYNHAYNFTHFSKKDKTRLSVTKLTLAKKAKLIFLGHSNPKRMNDTLPSIPYETIALESDVKLQGWLMLADSAKGSVVIFHGYTGSMCSLLDNAYAFCDMGYHVLMIDFRGSGGSEGYTTTIGMDEAKDVEAAYDYMHTRFPNRQTWLYGVSMGAAAIMRAMHEKRVQPTGLMLECPFASMLSTVKNRFAILGVPATPFAELLVFYGGIINDFNAFQHNPVDYAKEITVPTLILAGALDDRVKLEDVKDIYNNLAGEKHLEIFTKAAHENFIKRYRQQWEKTVRNFQSAVDNGE